MYEAIKNKIPFMMTDDVKYRMIINRTSAIIKYGK